MCVPSSLCWQCLLECKFCFLFVIGYRWIMGLNFIVQAVRSHRFSTSRIDFVSFKSHVCGPDLILCITHRRVGLSDKLLYFTAHQNLWSSAHSTKCVSLKKFCRQSICRLLRQLRTSCPSFIVIFIHVRRSGWAVVLMTEILIWKLGKISSHSFMNHR